MSASDHADKTRRHLLQGAAALLTSACSPLPSGRRPEVETSEVDSGLLADSGGSGPLGGAPSTEDWMDTGVAPPSTCQTTQVAGEGPYYIDGAPSLTDLTGTGESGTLITLSFTVRDAACELVADAELDFWHVQQDAEYDMSGAEGNYRCTVRTGFDGTVVIKTLKPIAYPLSDTDWMPAHFHFKIRALGHSELITQLRFTGDPYENGQVPTEQLLTPTVNADGSEEASYTFVLST